MDLNPILVSCSSNERGSFAAFEFRDLPPSLIEVIHLRPHQVHANHRHRHCTELLNLVSGELDIYLLCNCSGRHLFRKQMQPGDSVCLPPGTAHAFDAQSALTVISIFIDGDPRMDCEPVELIYLPGNAA